MSRDIAHNIHAAQEAIVGSVGFRALPLFTVGFHAFPPENTSLSISCKDEL